MPEQQQFLAWDDDPAAVVDVPEPMVMQRADEVAKERRISYNGSMAKPGRIIKTKRPSILSSSPNADNTTDSSSSRGTSFSQSHNIQSQKPFPPTIQRGKTDENNGGGGFLSAPLAWVQRHRELRRRLQLQQEAEEQLRKIAEAELIRRNGDSSGSASVSSGGAGGRGGKNPYCNTALPGNWFSANDGSDEELKIGTQHLSKSGEGMTAELDLDDDDDEDEYLVPKVRILPEPRLIMKAPSDDSIESPRKSDSRSQTYILTPEQMHQIAIHVLPRGIAYCPWRRVYSLSRDGDSFDGCLRIISDVPRTLLVIRTTRGAIFGGYADSPWRSVEMGNARFYGSAQACLFSVKNPYLSSSTNGGLKSPSSLLNVYPWSGKNRYIQLCDMSSKMLAFGGGGVDGAFGLCIQEDFQTGSTGPCDTFDNAPLCDQDTFEIVDVEFWEFMTGVF